MSSPSTKGSFFVPSILTNSAAHAEHSDTTQASQTAPSQPGTGSAPTADKTAPLAASPNGTVSIPVAFRQSGSPQLTPCVLSTEQEKQPATNDATPAAQAAGAAAQPAIVEAPAAAKNYQAPVLLNEKAPLPSSDPTSDPPATKLDTEADDEDVQDEDVDDPEPAVPAGATPRVLTAQERRRRARLLIIHTRLAKFFAWILLLGFVILPGTFSKTADIRDVPLYVPSLSICFPPKKKAFFSKIVFLPLIVVDLTNI